MLKNLFHKLNILSKQIFSINIVDGHLFIFLFGIKLRKKLKSSIKTPLVQSYGLNTEARDTKIIASLTSFPQRIEIIHNTIATLLTQTLKPDKLILWLAEEQFPNKENDLPQSLLNLIDFGLTISWCEDLRSYKKLLPTLAEHPNDIIITFDDDIYYPNNTIEILYNSYLQEPKSIHTNRARILYLKNNELYSRPLGETIWSNNRVSSYLNKVTGCGGVLYPPNSLNNKVFDKESFPTAKVSFGFSFFCLSSLSSIIIWNVGISLIICSNLISF